MINMKKISVMMTLLNNFQMMKTFPIMRMVFHPKVTTNWDETYWLCGIGISLY